MTVRNVGSRLGGTKSWQTTKTGLFITGLQISTHSRIGVLSDVAAVLAASRVNVHEISARDLNDGFGIINAMVDVAGVAQLDNIINRLRGIKGIVDVTRTVDSH